MVERTAVGVDEVVDAVLGALRGTGYAEVTVIRYRTILRRLARFCRQYSGEYTRELGMLFAAQTTSPRSGQFSLQRWFDHGRCVRLADSYLLTGRVDLSMQKTVERPLSSPAFRDLLSAWDLDMSTRRLAASTSYQCHQAARCFLADVEARGVRTVDGLTGGLVVAFLATLGGSLSPAGLRSFIAAFRPFCKFTGRDDLVAGLAGLRFERPRLIIPVLSVAETDAIFRVMTSGVISARDKAIVLLALTFGLRAADIVALRIEDIDWRGECIDLVQTKTGNPVRLPLLPAVGNALSDYLLGERPATEMRAVFVRTGAPYIALCGHSGVYAVMRRVFTRAGLVPGRCGARLTRHNIASRMLVAGTATPTISAVLGHVDPASADRYLSTDADRLRALVLPLPQAVLA